MSDICDPDPTFVLVSITSDEPPNDHGDGNTQPDIVDADLGTDDVEFKLRAERDGRQNGRKYTIVYQASDECGNTTNRSVCVTVDHDQMGVAKAAQGFLGDGVSFERGNQTFALVVESVAYVRTDPGAPSAEGAESLDVGGEIRAGFDAARVDLRHAYIGNTAGWALPVDAALVDNNGDGLRDLVLHYSVPSAEKIIVESDALDGPVGLHYQTQDGEMFLVSDIFGLGTPVALVELPVGTEKPQRDEVEEPEIATEKRDAESTDDAGMLEVTAIPTRDGLLGIQPNPFNPSTTVVFGLIEAQSVRIDVFNIQGELVRQLESGVRSAGRHEVAWNGRDNAGRSVASGVYVFVMSGERVQESMKAILLK